MIPLHAGLFVFPTKDISKWGHAYKSNLQTSGWEKMLHGQNILKEIVTRFACNQQYTEFKLQTTQT